MTLLSLVLISTGCEERIDSPVVNPSEGETVEVSMTIGLADEVDGYNLSASTKAFSQKKGAFNMELVPTETTRSTTSSKPDALYQLEIRQYDQGGNYLNGNGPQDQTIGKKVAQVPHWVPAIWHPPKPKVLMLLPYPNLIRPIRSI